MQQPLSLRSKCKQNILLPTGASDDAATAPTSATGRLRPTRTASTAAAAHTDLTEELFRAAAFREKATCASAT